jgi:hypothetical protein
MYINDILLYQYVFQTVEDSSLSSSSSRVRYIDQSAPGYLFPCYLSPCGCGVSLLSYLLNSFAKLYYLCIVHCLLRFCLKLFVVFVSLCYIQRSISTMLSFFYFCYICSFNYLCGYFSLLMSYWL